MARILLFCLIFTHGIVSLAVADKPSSSALPDGAVPPSSTSLVRQNQESESKMPAIAEAPEDLHSVDPMRESKRVSGGEMKKESEEEAHEIAEAPENRKMGKHKRSSEESVAGGGVIIGGLATAILAAVFCYIRVTRKKQSENPLHRPFIYESPPPHSNNCETTPTLVSRSGSVFALHESKKKRGRARRNEGNQDEARATKTKRGQARRSEGKQEEARASKKKRGQARRSESSCSENMANETAVMAVIRASRPTFRNAHDKVAFALHSSFLAAGYVLTATGSRAFTEEASSATASSSGQEEVGIDGWNEYDDCYGFVYSKSEKGSNKKVVVKCLTFDDKLAVDVLRCGSDQEPLHLEVNVKDHVSSEATGSTSYGDVYKNFGALINSLNSSVLSKLEDKNKSNTTARSSRSGSTDGTGVNPTYPRVPDSRESGIIYPPVIPGESSDLYPGPGAGFFPHRIIYPPVIPGESSDLYPGPGAGFFPHRGDMGVGGSMLVGPDDPRWWGGRHPDTMPGVPGVPPGARFDPYGPPDVPGFEPGRFARNPPRRPGRDVHPDLQHFRDDDFV
ncbi:hypothetical protein H6P81_007226 [Aristolochia fimbriata]|uniref:PI31 proteasome regulator N-terminal domain-containing protein n=1 Tax=Aristolochia fimbriata TaxID=158543 RepID=A0AAV7F3E8_ARIFI|nr:hypothetical protein H6P81_007226 [Aristolochia fimbriata]